MCLNTIGSIAHNQWVNLLNSFEMISLGDFQIMPDHMHGIILIHEDNQVSLKEVIGAYKSLVNHESLKLFKHHNMKMGQLWQRNFYEHIIRDYRDFENASAYIRNNLTAW